MDIDDKLKELRRDRESRERAHKVQKTWERIDGEEGLTTKEKLERLITLTKKGPAPRATSGHGSRPAQRKEPVQLHENPYQLGARYGQIPIAMGLEIPGSILAFLSRDTAFEELDLGSAVFLDLETTGLAGGTGTVPFLVGLGYYRDERFKVTQFFLGDMAEEAGLIHDVGRFFKEMGFRFVVTYNGKAFDVPLLETRFTLHRTPFPLIFGRRQPSGAASLLDVLAKRHGIKPQSAQVMQAEEL